jgi:hypothetical protein
MEGTLSVTVDIPDSANSDTVIDRVRELLDELIAGTARPGHRHPLGGALMDFTDSIPPLTQMTRRQRLKLALLLIFSRRDIWWVPQYGDYISDKLTLTVLHPARKAGDWR